MRIEPSAVIVRNLTGPPIHHVLEGAPLQVRRIKINGLAPGRPTLTVEGLDGVVSLPFDGPVLGVQRVSGARLKEPAYHTGPPPTPDPRWNPLQAE